MQNPTAHLKVVLPPAYRLRCWGEFALLDQNGVDRSPNGRKARALVAYLASRPGIAVRRDKLTELLWGGRDERQARSSLRQSLFELRHLSSGDGPLSVTRDHVMARPQSLAVEDDIIAAAAAAGDLPALAELISSGDGELFIGLDGVSEGFDEWLAVERSRRKKELLTVARRAAEAGVRNGYLAAARRVISCIEALDPLEEETARLGMLADARAGDAAALERRYVALRGRLSAELGVAPSAETEALHRTLLDDSKATVDELPGASALANTLPLPVCYSTWPSLRSVALIGAVLLALLIGGYALLPTTSNQPASIAVLPFRNFAGETERHFADGVSEEILSSLSRNPRLRVMGRTSAWSFRNQALDSGEIGRRLGVTYLLEGSVRRVGSQVRVNVGLVRASDGMQLWAEEYHRPLDDIFAIQDSIASAVADRIGGGAGGIPKVSPLTTSGDVYSLYLVGRSLMRDREPARLDAAAELLRRAARMDPNYAPAWAGLGSAVRMRWWYSRSPQSEAATRKEALAYERRALALQPDLAEAHAAIGMILDYRGPQAAAHLRKAVQLDPNSAENWYWLSNAYGRDDDFARQLQACRRAAAIDPLWGRAYSCAVDLAWNLGYRDEAFAYLRRVETASEPGYAHLMRAVMAGMRNDFSQQALHGRAALKALERPDRRYATAQLAYALLPLGYIQEAARAEPAASERAGIALGRLPSPSEFRARYSGRVTYWQSDVLAVLTRRMMLKAGRAHEIVQLYDQDFGSPEAMVQHREGLRSLLDNTVITSIALRRAGRDKEATRLLELMERALRERLRNARMPLFLYEPNAALLAGRGKHDAALMMLERALNLGWHYGYDAASLRDIGEDPRFESLHKEPRYQRIRERLNAHIAKERRELGPVAAFLSEIPAS